jgi:hypothetical protein
MPFQSNIWLDNTRLLCGNLEVAISKPLALAHGTADRNMQKVIVLAGKAY